MSLRDDIVSLKKYRNSLTYYKQNKDKISESNMKVSNGIVYISPLNDMEKHIEREVKDSDRSVLRRILGPKTGGYIFFGYFLSIILVVILLALSIMLATFIIKGA